MTLPHGLVRTGRELASIVEHGERLVEAVDDTAIPRFEDVGPVPPRSRRHAGLEYARPIRRPLPRRLRSGRGLVIPRSNRSTAYVHVTFGVFAAAMIGAMAYVLETGSRMNVKSFPRIDAVVEMKLAATLAHLWFEEILSGDRHESIDEVWRQIDRADSYAAALLDGGGDEVGSIHPVEEAGLRRRIHDLRARLDEFRRVTGERWQTKDTSAAGSPHDQRYDGVFAEVMVLADAVEDAVRRSIRSDFVAFRRVQTSLIVGGILLSIFVMLIVARYLAQRDRAAREAADLRDRLTHVTRVGTLGGMATGIAHEINQPLTAIATTARACIRLLAAGRTDHEELRHALDRIAAEALRAGEVIAHLRSLIERRAGRRAMARVNDVVRDAVRLAEVDAKVRGFRTGLDLAPGLPTVVVDAVQIQQVILNLVRNGMEAMEGSDAAEGVTVSTREGEGGSVEIAVEDRGVGFPEEGGEESFAPFFTTKADGLGMGLSISRSIVTSHGGTMWFTRNPTRGLTARFTLPAAMGGDHEQT